mmetsp:Transcript_22269/g.37776  ORF Transcript_22269/g.37776 Transcript_22269/m.37776 type:complete len:184 (+) Transcript_22269:79-630(+)
MPADDKQKKAALKEGGKKGQDLEGMADMGGVQFFHVAMDSPNGDFELLELCMEGANKDVNPEGDDRKGGSKNLAKIFLSAGPKDLIALAYVPEALKEKLDIKEWLELVISSVGGSIEGEVTEKNTLKAVAKGDGDKNLFPLKMRDTAIGAGFAFLRKKGLVVDEDSDDDVDYGALAENAGIEW